MISTEAKYADEKVVIITGCSSSSFGHLATLAFASETFAY